MMQEFLNAYKGTIFPGNWSNQMVVWCFHDKIQGVSCDEWNAIDTPVIQRVINSMLHDVKIRKDMENPTVVTYYVNFQTN